MNWAQISRTLYLPLMAMYGGFAGLNFASGRYWSLCADAVILLAMTATVPRKPLAAEMEGKP